LNFRLAGIERFPLTVTLLLKEEGSSVNASGLRSAGAWFESRPDTRLMGSAWSFLGMFMKIVLFSAEDQ
jgi:hypothetical protein